MPHSAMIYAAAGLTTQIVFAFASAATFSGCDPAEYYRDLPRSPPSRHDLHDKLRTTHSKSLPYTSSSVPDTWDALLDLDGIVDTNTGFQQHVQLIYARQETMAAEPRGTSDTWNREHIYPKSAGVGTGGPDYTDLFALRPSLSRVNSARGNKWFGQCGIEGGGGTCRRPAHELAAEDTETDGRAWLPPADVRGDIARALFYMDLRYDGDGDEFDLLLSDCTHSVLDDGRVNELGYLSELLQWHLEDPVDEKERLRNDRICRAWQGNRNPFIDHPDWVEVYFGKPAELIGDGGGYASCIDDYLEDSGMDESDLEDSDTPIVEDGIEEEIGGDIPTSPVEGSCNGLDVGDIAVIAAGSDDPDAFQLVALADVQSGTEIYVTDNAYTGYKLRDNEGTVKYKAEEVISAGSIITYTHGSPEWTAVGGSFSLSASGDTILVYCIGDEPDITFLSALSYSGEFSDPDVDENAFGSSQSALPPLEIESKKQGFFSFLSGTQFAATALEHEDNVWYVGPREGTRDDLWDYLADPVYWEGSNTDPPPLVSGNFIVSIEEATSGSTGTFGVGFSLWPLLYLTVMLCR